MCIGVVILISHKSDMKHEGNSLSDHTPIPIQFPQSPKTKASFQYCDMWANHVNFLPIIIEVLPSHSNAFPLLKLKKYMDLIRVKLSNLNRTSFRDLRERQELAR